MSYFVGVQSAATNNQRSHRSAGGGLALSPRQRLRKKRSLKTIIEKQSEPDPENRYFSLIARYDKQGVTPGANRSRGPPRRERTERRGPGSDGTGVRMCKYPNGRRPCNPVGRSGTPGRPGVGNGSQSSRGYKGRLGPLRTPDNPDLGIQRNLYYPDRKVGVVEPVIGRRNAMHGQLQGDYLQRQPPKESLDGEPTLGEPGYDSSDEQKTQEWWSSVRNSDFSSLVKVKDTSGIFKVQVEEGILTLQLARSLKPSDYHKSK